MRRYSSRALSRRLKMCLPGREMFKSALDNRLTMAIAVTFLLYVFCMDITLYKVIQDRAPLRTGGGVNASKMVNHPYSPFRGLSVKLMMMDQINHYVMVPLALIFNSVTNLSTAVLWVTPNMISVAGMLFAFAGARCATYDNPGLHRIGVLLMLVRGFFDALDGLVARERLGIVQSLSIRNSSGYVVDGVCDNTGGIVYVIGCFIYLKKTVPKQKHLGAITNKNSVNHPKSNPGTSLRRIIFAFFCFFMQTVISSALWDHYSYTYHTLLETPRMSEPQAIVQNKVLKSTLMWIIFWCWKMSSSLALLNYYLGAVFLNRLWVFLTWIQYLGFIEIFTLIIFTEIHLHDVQAYIEMVQ